MTSVCSGLARAILLPILVLMAAACVTAPDPADTEAYADFQARNDPLEPVNRGLYQVNRVLDVFFLKPAAGWYRALTPPPLQKAISNLLHNLNSLVILANDLMQGEFDRAGDTVARFAINTTVGVGGMLDIARDEFGIARHSEDFGQTLAVWGVPEGPFLFLPVLGPSNPRDAAGLAVDTFLLDPFAWWVRARQDDREIYSYTRFGARLITARAEFYDGLEDIEKNSLDPYAALRSFYRQFRAREIANGRATADSGPALPDIPELEEIPDAEGESPPTPIR